MSPIVSEMVFVSRRRHSLYCSLVVILWQLHCNCLCGATFTNRSYDGALEGICTKPDAPQDIAMKISAHHSHDSHVTVCNSFIQLGAKQVQVPSTASIVESLSEGDQYLTDAVVEGASKDGLQNLITNASEEADNRTKTNKTSSDGNQTDVGITKVAAKLVVALMLAGIIIAAVILAMTHSSNLQLSSLSTFALETTLSFFVGVFWFQALQSVFGMIRNRHHQVAVSIGIAIVLFLIFLVLAWLVRRKRTVFAIVTGCCAYIAAFVFTYAAYISQKHYYSDHWMSCLHGFCVLLVGMAMLFSLCYLLKLLLFQDPYEEGRSHDVHHWEYNMEHMQYIFFGMAVAFVFTEFVQFLIAGKFPQMKGVNVKARHTNMEAHLLLGWVIVVVAIGGFIVWTLAAAQEFKRHFYGAHLACGFICSFLSMCIAWAFLDWGHWYMYEMVDLGPMFARIVFAMICSVIWIIGVCFLAAVRMVNPRFCHYFVLALSLVCAWSWGQVFEMAFDRVFDQWWAKVGVACVVSACIIPIMALLMKPAAHHIHQYLEPSHKQLREDGHDHEFPRPAYEPRATGMPWAPPITMSETRLDARQIVDTRPRLSSPMPVNASTFRPDFSRNRTPSPSGLIGAFRGSPPLGHPGTFRQLPASRIHTAPLA